VPSGKGGTPLSEDVFRAEYADHYDLLYLEKDYEAECDLLEKMFNRHGDGKVRTVLDLGCGTGGHTLPLFERGYQVTGVDRSPEMLAMAKHKLGRVEQDNEKCTPTFLQGDLRTLDLDQVFDAVLMMFAVLSYQQTNDDVLAALHTVRRHLRPGGLFLADVWYGPAVLQIKPSDRLKIVELVDGQLIRSVTADLDVQKHLCNVHYNIWRLRNGNLVTQSQEDHMMRFFFPMELMLYFKMTKLEMIGIYPFPNVKEEVDSSTWNVLICGRAIS
jgi:SAM-dependent methyltransferase